MRPRQQQIGIAIAVAVARATRKLRVAEGNKLRDRRDAAILHANFFQMRAAIRLLASCATSSHCR